MHSKPQLDAVPGQGEENLTDSLEIVLLELA